MTNRLQPCSEIRAVRFVKKIFRRYRRKTIISIIAIIAAVCVVVFNTYGSRAKNNAFSKDEINHDLNPDDSPFDGGFQFMSSILKKIQSSRLQGRTTRSKDFFEDQYISLSEEMQSVLRVSEKRRQSMHLSGIVSKRINDIQNPTNCSTAKLLIYDVTSHECGFGCNLRKVILYFMQAIHENRTFVLQSIGWQYDRQGWEHHLLPLGKCQYEHNMTMLPLLSSQTKHERVVKSDEVNFSGLDWSVPENVLSKLKMIHQDPFAWWVGQFVAYAFRFQPWFKRRVEIIGNRIGLSQETVGIHVRWGDKVNREATKHEVHEYMDFVETWFRRSRRDGIRSQRVVYVATENSEVWKDLKEKYPKFRFIGGGFVNESVDLEPEKNRHYEDRRFALESILIDLYVLSKCDYVVCTGSSGICRVIYALLMLEKADAPERLQSIDVGYYFWKWPTYRAIESHKKRNAIDLQLEIGDEISAIFDRFNQTVNGYYRGRNTRTGLEGHFPMYKAELIVRPLKSSVFEDL